MSPLTPPLRTPRRPRPGFSLVELLVVIAIIGILMAFILPGLFSARDTVRTAEVSTEIKGLEQGIAEFKTQFGQEPPSGIDLFEVGGTWSTQSSVILQQFWPQFNFNLPHDFDQDGMIEADPDGDGNNGIALTGDECLLFFLGGVDTIVFYNSTTMVTGDTNGNSVQDVFVVADGFSSNPADPFQQGGNRVGPFFEFDPDRMIDYEGFISGTRDGAHSYSDLYTDRTVPYLYLSSYGGRSFRPGSDGDLNQNSTYDALIELQDVYLQVIDNPSTANVNERRAWKDQSYQIISSGGDGEFGIGGLWSNEDGFPTGSSTSKDRDNITNFSGGRLE